MNNLEHCAPILQDSPALGFMDPAWARCGHKVAMLDPPLALTPRKALRPAPLAPTSNSGAPTAATVAAPASPAAKPTPTPTPAPRLPAPVNSPKSDPQRGAPNDPASAKDPAANDSHANNLFSGTDPASVKDSAGSDLSTDSDPADIAQEPAENPASAKESFNDGSPANKYPVVLAQNS